MRVLQIISIACLWGALGLNLWVSRRHFRLNKKLMEHITALHEAKENCDKLASQLNKALDELQNNGVEAAMAVFMEEDAV